MATQNLGFSTFKPGQNPYLQANVGIAQNDISKQYQSAIAPRQASMNAASGSFGNSGLQQMQLEDQRQLQQNLGNVATQIYGNAYNTDQANNLSFTNANNANDTQRYTSDNALKGTRYASDNALKGSMYGADSSKAASMYGADSALKGSMYGADASKAASMYGTDKNYNLGMTNAGISQQNANTNAANVANQYELGQGQNAIGMQNANTNRQQVDNTYNLGLGTLGNNYLLGQQNYDLGLRSNDVANATLDANINNSNFNNNLNGAKFGLDVVGALNASNTAGINAGTNIQNAPLDYQKIFSDMQNSIANGYGTNTTTGANSTAANVLGGATMANTAYNNLGFGGGGYSPSNIGSYGDFTVPQGYQPLPF